MEGDPLITQLLERSESEVLDFKLIIPDVAGISADERKRKNASFAKDVISMANTPRTEPAYILYGAKKGLDGKIESPGIAEHIDDNILQQCIESTVHPHPVFRYEQHTHKDVQFGLLVIEPNQAIGPFLAKEDVDGSGLRRNVLYLRRGSKNAEASPQEQKQIHSWFRRDRMVADEIGVGPEAWGRFVRLANPTALGRQYIFILAPSKDLEPSLFKHLAACEWNMVIDFDPETDISGALFYAAKELSARRAIHRLTKDEETPGSISRGTVWYFAKGISGRMATLTGSTYASWNKSFGNDLRKKLLKIAQNSSEPVVLITLAGDPELTRYVQKTLGIAGEIFGERLIPVVVSESNDLADNLAQEVDAQVCEIEPRHFLEGLGALGKVSISDGRISTQMPGRDGVPKIIEPEDEAWFNEDFELVHFGAGNHWEAENDPEKEFLQGATISWFGLGIGADVQREKLKAVEKGIRKDLTDRRTSRINLFHKPGAGGTTVARRIAWTLHEDYPTILLRRCVPRETLDRIARLYALCEAPLLIIREGHLISDGEADQLADLLKNRRIPSVMLQVVRRYSEVNEGERSFFLSDELTRVEIEWFRVKLAKVKPENASQILSLVQSDGPKTPFIFGLTAFEKDFNGLQPYVKNHLKHLPEPQMKILLFLAIAHAYGQQEMAAQDFADLLGLPLSSVVDFKTVLGSQCLGLIVEGEPGFWRTSHDLVAREIIRLQLSQGQSDDRNWNLRLADVACEFAKFCRSPLPVQSDEMLALVERVFFYRDDSEVLGSLRAGENLFAEIINHIPLPEGRLRVYEKLVELFPDRPHCWAHLGRFLSIRLHEFNRAVEAIDKAISLNSKDHVLHHMKGMCLRSLVYDELDVGKPLAEIVGTAKEASRSFEEARQLEPDEEHGYISEAQLIIRFLDRARSIEKADAPSLTVQSSTDPWLRECFQKVEDLLLVVRQKRGGETASKYEELCRADLDSLYGAHDKALERWNNLLQRRDLRGNLVAYSPPIRRQIVWAQLARCERDWSRMEPAKLRRSIELLETNLEEEPADDRNIRLWIQGARFLADPPKLERCIERVASWRTNGDSLEAAYYLYVLHALQAFNGSPIASDRAMRALEECKNRARYRRDRTRSFEWLASGAGLNQLVHQDQLGTWDKALDFWKKTKALSRVEGIVSNIRGSQAGEIETKAGIKAFFVPGLAGISAGRDENIRVSFYLGFSYEGLRAWSVSPV